VTSCLNEDAETEKQGREWAAQFLERVSNIARLNQVVSDVEAAIKEMDRKERERIVQEKQAQGWLSYLTNPWAANPVQTEQEKTKEHLKRPQQRVSKSIKLEWARNQLTQAEQEHQRLLAMERQTREREAREREERLREERMKAQREQNAKSRETSERKTKEDAVRAREAASRKAEESQREAARKAREREAAQKAANQRRQETERRERDLRQHLFERFTKQIYEDRMPQQNQNRDHLKEFKKANTIIFRKLKKDNCSELKAY